MDSNIEICLEELDTGPEEECFVRCVAVSGGQPGLALDPDGLVRWMPEAEDGCHGLWVSDDGKLMFYGAEVAEPVVVERGSRTQKAPAGQPVVLLDQDLLCVGDRRLLVHVHGQTEQLYEPERLTRSAMRKFLQAAAAAATLTLGAAGLAAGPAGGVQATVGEPAPIEVRTRPPSVAARVRLDCKVTRQAVKKGKLHVWAYCANPKKVRVGSYGNLLHKKSGRNVQYGTVKVDAIKGKTVHVVATRLKARVKDLGKVRFWVSP